MDGFVKLSIDNYIGVINFHHPKGNSLPSVLLKQLKEAFLKLEKEGARVIVLQSEGESVFCSGASFSELLALKDFHNAQKFFLGFAELMEEMVSSSAIIIGKVVGKVIGGGVGIVSACDYVIAGNDSLFKLSELKVGIGPFAIGPMVMSKVGQSNFAKITYSPNDWFSVKSEEIGNLISEVSNLTDIDIVAQNKAEEFISFNSKAIQEVKKMIWKNKEDIIQSMKINADISADLVLQNEAQQFLKEFKK